MTTWYNDDKQSSFDCSYCVTASAVGDHSPSCDCGCHLSQEQRRERQFAADHAECGGCALCLEE